MYSVGSDAALAAVTRRVIEAIPTGRLAATTTVGVIEEFTHVAARRRGHPEAVGLARRFVKLLSPLRTEEAQDLDVALGLFERHPQIGAYDALLAAVAMAHGDTLLSPDADFALVPGLSFSELTHAELDRMIGDR